MLSSNTAPIILPQSKHHDMNSSQIMHFVDLAVVVMEHVCDHDSNDKL